MKELYVEFFGHTGSGKTSLVNTTYVHLKPKGDYELVKDKKSFYKRISVQTLLKTVLRFSKMILFGHKYKLRDKEFMKVFFVNYYIKEYCSKRKEVVFLNDHGFMMSLLATHTWHRLNSTPFELSDEFMSEYLRLVAYRGEDILLYLHVSAKTARGRESKRKKFSFTEGVIATLYSSEEMAMRIIEKHMPAHIIKNEDLDATTKEVIELIKKRLRG